MVYSQRSSRATSSHTQQQTRVHSDIEPGDSISQVKDPKVQTWRMNIEHHDNSDWSLHRSDAYISKNDDARFLPGTGMHQKYYNELSATEKAGLAYYPSTARLINEVKKDEYSNDRRRLARAIGWCIYKCNPFVMDIDTYQYLCAYS